MSIDDHKRRLSSRKFKVDQKRDTNRTVHEVYVSTNLHSIDIIREVVQDGHRGVFKTYSELKQEMDHNLNASIGDHPSLFLEESLNNLRYITKWFLDILESNQIELIEGCEHMDEELKSWQTNYESEEFETQFRDLINSNRFNYIMLFVPLLLNFVDIFLDIWTFRQFMSKDQHWRALMTLSVVIGSSLVTVMYAIWTVASGHFKIRYSYENIIFIPFVFPPCAFWYEWSTLIKIKRARQRLYVVQQEDLERSIVNHQDSTEFMAGVHELVDKVAHYALCNVGRAFLVSIENFCGKTSNFESKTNHQI